MKKNILLVLILLLTPVLAACGNDVKKGKNSSPVQDIESPHGDSVPESETEKESGSKEETGKDMVKTELIYIKVGESALTAVLEDNESVGALKKLLADGPLTIPASNYGGFEKVCSLGTKLPRNDKETTTHAGDICLYSGNQIVIFYGSNSWAYTRLGKVPDMDEAELERVLGGEETKITLSLEPFR